MRARKSGDAYAIEKKLEEVGNQVVCTRTEFIVTLENRKIDQGKRKSSKMSGEKSFKIILTIMGVVSTNFAPTMGGFCRRRPCRCGKKVTEFGERVTRKSPGKSLG